MADASIQKLVDLFMQSDRMPTDEEMDAIGFKSNVLVSSESYKRPPEERIFATRALRLDKIDYFGCKCVFVIFARI